MGSLCQPQKFELSLNHKENEIWTFPGQRGSAKVSYFPKSKQTHDRDGQFVSNKFLNWVSITKKELYLGKGRANVSNFLKRKQNQNRDG